MAAGMTGPSPVQQRRILVVDDQYMLAADMKRELEEMDVLVIGPVSTVPLALRLLAVTPVLDGAILAIDLQREPSFRVADVLQARGIPFVFTTRHKVAILPAAYRSVRRFQKPVDVREVVQAILD
jgi:DNA-binding NarL/FixJ family response regulator